MKLIQSKVELIEQGNSIEDMYKHIERCGRVCYKSEDKITEDSAKEFVDRLIKSGHGAMLEHGTVYLEIHLQHRDYIKYTTNPYSKVNKVTVDGVNGRAYITTNYRVLVENNWLDDLKYVCEPTEHHEKRITVKFTCDRVTGESFLRHRVFSFARESTRFCNYSKDKFNNEITFIIPSWITDIHSENSYDMELINNYSLAETENMNPESIEFVRSLVYSESSYFTLLEAGWKPQQARQVLPFCIKSPLIMTGFESDWKHFFDLRCAKNAHPDAQKLANELKELMYGSKEV